MLPLVERRTYRRGLGLVVSVISLVFATVLAELVLRWRAIGPIPAAETSLHYRHDDLLGWHPAAGDRRTILGSRRFTVEHNSEGFRDREHGVKTKPRIMFVGDSFVWGFDVDQRERFTDLVQDALPDWDVINVGVAGYGTDQEYLLLTQVAVRYQPDLVFLMFCADNDRNENSSNKEYGFYKPYFVREGGELALKGTPVRRSETYWFNEHPWLFSFRLTRAVAKVLHPYPGVEVPDPTLDLLRSIARLLEQRHVPLLVGLTARDPGVEGYLTSAHIPFLMFADIERYSTFGLHWTVAGNRVVSRRVLTLLQPLLARQSAP
jgi:hypothetical protein